MEIGHNVLHGQWDWMNDPDINSTTWDWDTASTAEAWKHSYNYVHHTYTNIRGKDKDLGYEIMRIDPQQRWNPVYLLQPIYNLILAAFFELGVALHDLDFEAIRKGTKSKAQVQRELKGIGAKAKSQVVKDYVAWPLISGLAAAAADLGLEFLAASRENGLPRGRKGLAPMLIRSLRGGAKTYRRAAAANATANIVRNVWSYAIIFCGHFPTRPTRSVPRRSSTRAGAAGMCGKWSAPPTSTAVPSSMSPAETSVTRSSTTSSLTCRAAAMRRSLRRSRMSANAMGSPTTAGRSGSSSAWFSGPSCDWPFPAERRGRSRAPTERLSRTWTPERAETFRTGNKYVPEVLLHVPHESSRPCVNPPTPVAGLLSSFLDLRSRASGSPSPTALRPPFGWRASS